MTARTAGLVVAMTAALIGCSAGPATRIVVVRGSENPIGGNIPGAVREAAGVPLGDCQAWQLDMGFGGGSWEMHLRVPTARVDDVRQRLAGTAGVESVKVKTRAAAPTGFYVAHTICFVPPHMSRR